MDRIIKSSFTLLQNKLSDNDEIIIITSKFVLYKNKTYIKDNNSWKKTDEDAESLIDSFGFSSKNCSYSFYYLFILILFLELQGLEDLKKENEELKKVINELMKEKGEEIEEIEELTQKFSLLKVKKNVALQQIDQIGQVFTEQVKSFSNSQEEVEFRVPSPIEYKFVELTGNDILSEDEEPLQSKSEGTFYQ
jgi:hypothetical protein